MSASTEPLAFIVTYNEGRPGPGQPIEAPSFTIGRDIGNDLCLFDDPAVSRQHCVIQVVGESLLLEDLGSRNGTYLNGDRMTEVALLPVPSEMMVGNTRLTVHPPRPLVTEVTSVIDTSNLSDDSIRLPSSGIFIPRTEAFMVVDLVDSTSLVQQGEISFSRVVLAMGRLLERCQLTEPQPFLKCTGDGYFACFSTPAAALDASMRLAPGLARALPVDVRISVALHWGLVQLPPLSRDRTGRNVHAVFSLEQVRHHDEALEEEMRSRRTNELVLMTEAFWSELDEPTRARAKPLGFYRLKGLEEGAHIYRWTG